MLLDFCLKEMYKFASILSNSAIWDILIILKNYGEELDKGVKSDNLLENTKTCIFRGETFFNIFIRIKKNTFLKKSSIEQIKKLFF